MNRLVGFALVGGLLASSAAASGTGASRAAHEVNAYLAVPAAQKRMASAVQPLSAPRSVPAPANTTQRTIHASEAAPRPALAPAPAELAPASQTSPTSCPPARTDLACRKP